MKATSYRVKLQTAFVLLGLTAIAATGWQASDGATTALRQATFDRLQANLHARTQQLTRYFEDAHNHVRALSSDESTIETMEQLAAAWRRLPEPSPEMQRQLRGFFEKEYLPRIPPAFRSGNESWFPAEPRTQTLQYHFIAANPHPMGRKDLLLEVPALGEFGRIHALFHPTLQRYQGAFGFHDIFLIDGATGRILYTVAKELDIGVRLTEAPYATTSLAKVYRRVMTDGVDEVLIEDYQPYGPSHFEPAAFLAAPVMRGGAKIGVLAIQLSIAEVNRVVREGPSAVDAYVVGADGKLRSDASTDRKVLSPMFAPDRLAGELAGGLIETRNADQKQILRAHEPLKWPALGWSVLAEVPADEAFAPVRSVQRRILSVGALVALAFLLTARRLADSVTRPLLALAAGVQRLGQREFGTRVPVETNDEIGSLAQAVNRMAEDLERTTVSREELAVLAQRLIAAQEEERSRVARELHDDLTQQLAAAAIEAGRLSQSRFSDDAQWRTALGRIKERLAALSTDVQTLSRRLHPAMLRDLGLAAAVESECRAFFERGGPPVDLQIDGDFTDLAPDTTLAAYRVLQESLRNIEKHAGAEEVRVSLRRSEHKLELRIVDDGQGFARNVPEFHAGLGLASMEERARLLEGSLAVLSEPGQGTRVVLHLPIKTHVETKNPVS